MSLVGMIRGRRGASGFGYASTAEEVTEGVDLSGKSILITGANSGLGKESARVLAKRGARIYVGARTVEKSKPIADELGGGAVPLACELSEPESVRACVRGLKESGARLDVILCNAGIMALPERTIHLGQELQFLTNHLGHFVLVTGLLDQLTDDARVVVLSSAGHAWTPSMGIQFDDLNFANGYSGVKAYGQSKLANILFAKALARKFAGTKKTANALHPGVIATNLARHINPVLQALQPIGSAIAMKSIPEGAATQCYVAANPAVAGVTGEYFVDSNIARSSAHSRSVEMADRLWEVSEKIVAAI